MHYHFSICKDPTEIDVWEIDIGNDWAYSDSIFIHHSQSKYRETVEHWNKSIYQDMGMNTFIQNKNFI